MPPFITIEKRVGQTPLEALEIARETYNIGPDVPMAYAGRLDPMASGTLLILVGDECKKQHAYHGLDKEYEFAVLFGVRSDTGDVLGIIESTDPPQISAADLRRVTRNLRGPLTLQYPKFSSRTVAGKPLHTWAVEGRLEEITIPTYTANIYNLRTLNLRTEPATQLYHTAQQKIGSIPPVTDPRKALGNDFRRPEVRASWKSFLTNHSGSSFPVATFRCTGSSGLYMRTLAEVIATRLNTTALAFAIHRTAIGNYQSLPFTIGYWKKQF